MSWVSHSRFEAWRFTSTMIFRAFRRNVGVAPMEVVR